MFEDLFSGSSEKYWRSEGNNKRMRNYHKLSKILKIIKNVIFISLVIYCLILSTKSIFCLYDKYMCCDFNVDILNFINFKKFILDVYIITFILTLFVVFYFSKKKNYSKKQVSSSVLISLLFLPVSSLLVYNFVVLGSLMSSFYLVVVVVILNLLITFIVDKIDKLYDIAVGKKETNGKGEKKVCKGK